MAKSTRSGTGVGPAVSRYSFIGMENPSVMRAEFYYKLVSTPID
jgi:hypothetical protein